MKWIDFSAIKYYVRSYIGWPTFIFAVCIAAKFLGFQLWPADMVGYVMLIVAFGAVFFKGGSMDMLSLLFILYIPLALLIASPPALFNPWLRYGLFVLVFVVASPLLKHPKTIAFRGKVLAVLLWACALAGAGSFFCYFLGINLMGNVGAIQSLAGDAGLFGGLTNHSMTLGLIAGIGAVFSFSRAYQTKSKFYWGLCICSLGGCFFAASRSALMASIMGILTLLYFQSSSKGKFFKRLIGIGFLLIITYPIWSFATAGVMTKQQRNEESGSGLSSREVVWNERIEEFKSSPIVGVGFSSMSLTSSNYNASTGIVEPGTSWLAVLSMTGLVGFLFFVGIYVRSLIRAIRAKVPDSPLLIGLLVLVGIHMTAEGYIFAGGSFSCFLVWLIMGYATYARKIPQLGFRLI